MADATVNLPSLVQSLPRELYDEIFELVFTAPSFARAVVDRDYKPPAQMQVSRATRRHYARSYYETTTFVLVAKAFVERWAMAVPKHERALISRLAVQSEHIARQSHFVSPSLTSVSTVEILHLTMLVLDRRTCIGAYNSDRSLDYILFSNRDTTPNSEEKWQVHQSLQVTTLTKVG